MICLQLFFSFLQKVFAINKNCGIIIVNKCAILLGEGVAELASILVTVQKYAKQEHSYEGKSYSCHFNAGAAFSPHDGTTYSKLRRNCEIALQHSKHYAYGKLTLYNQDIADKRNQTLRVLHALKESINNNFENFSLVFQPKVTSSYHALTGFEALIRWNHQDFPHIGPGFFIPMLEESGDIIQLGDWIFEQAIIKLKDFSRYDKDINMSINVSYLQLMDDKFVDFIKEKVTLHQVNPYHIIIELTETSIAKNNELIVNKIQQLRQFGMRIAMDDFGTGYSSLSLLKNEPLDIIKIDQSFVRNITEDSFNYAFMNAIIDLCHQGRRQPSLNCRSPSLERQLIFSLRGKRCTGHPQLQNLILIIFKDIIQVSQWIIIMQFVF